MANFKLEILEQHWIGETPDGLYHDGSMDSCSHGFIRCEVGGYVLTTDSQEYGVIQSGLSLLRTVEQDHPLADRELWSPTPGFLICHGCGYPIGLGCTNVGADWSVLHNNGDVVISGPTSLDGKYVPPHLVIRMPLREYAREIVAFAREARRFYWSDGPRRVPPDEVEFHERFWAEFDDRLNRAEAAITAG